MFNLISSRKKKEQPLARLGDEFGALLDRFFSSWPAPLDTEYGIDRFWGLDVEDHDEEVVVRAEVPGFDPNELDVQLSGRQLTIKAEKKEEQEKAGNGPSEERSYRSFQRSVMLPEGIKAEGIDAKYHNGVLEVHLPKSEEAKPKHISVQV
jgi:HSP20 family protein